MMCEKISSARELIIYKSDIVELVSLHLLFLRQPASQLRRLRRFFLIFKRAPSSLSRLAKVR